MPSLPKTKQECKRCASLAFSSAAFFSGFLCVCLREKERACVFDQALQEEAYARPKHMGACSCFHISVCVSSMCLSVCDCSPAVPSRLRDPAAAQRDPCLEVSQNSMYQTPY